MSGKKVLISRTAGVTVAELEDKPFMVGVGKSREEALRDLYDQYPELRDLPVEESTPIL